MASIVVSNGKITFQGNVEEQFIKQNGVIYSVFLGEYENKAVRVYFDIKVKLSFMKSIEWDIVKSDHMIFQKTPAGTIFLLFETDRNDYVEEGDKMVYDESVKTKNYEYNFHFIDSGKEEKAEIPSTPIVDSSDVAGMVNSILKKYGVEEQSEDVSSVTEYMKTWKLGHPDEELER